MESFHGVDQLSSLLLMLRHSSQPREPYAVQPRHNSETEDTMYYRHP